MFHNVNLGHRAAECLLVLSEQFRRLYISHADKLSPIVLVPLLYGAPEEEEVKKAVHVAARGPLW